MTNAYIANQLVTLYDKDAVVTNLVDRIEWSIIPIVNCDGYVYTWTTNRLWRKNRYRTYLK
jgi:murein tripeptide amidase MpaA